MRGIVKGLAVIQPGIQSLVQDRGRFGFHAIGLTTGGPMDYSAFRWANRLCGNDDSAACIEVLMGGLVLQAQIATQIAVTGAEIRLTINHQSVDCWRSHCLHPGDRIELGHATAGCRAYLAATGGFDFQPSFGSAATVVREGLGGPNGDGQALKAGGILPCSPCVETQCLALDKAYQPAYLENTASLRVVLGYQQASFSQAQQQLFFNSDYRLSADCDRMGFRLAGAAINSSTTSLLSEGICLGAIQFPGDGQPIVLMRDRQTIGGYPKIGSVLSIDLDRMAQLQPGATVRFEPIGIERAHNLIHLSERRFHNTPLIEITD